MNKRRSQIPPTWAVACTTGEEIMKAHTLARKLLKLPNHEVLIEGEGGDENELLHTVKGAVKRKASDGGSTLNAIVVSRGEDTYYPPEFHQE